VCVGEGHSESSQRWAGSIHHALEVAVAMVEVVVWLCWLLCAVVWGGAGEWVDDGEKW
jgi:hypothetical protein